MMVLAVPFFYYDSSALNLESVDAMHIDVETWTSFPRIIEVVTMQLLQ